MAWLEKEIDMSSLLFKLFNGAVNLSCIETKYWNWRKLNELYEKNIALGSIVGKYFLDFPCFVLFRK